MAAAATGAEPRILGLGVAQRTALAARRAGYGQVLCLAPDGAALPGVAAVANWHAVAAGLGAGRAPPLVIAPATILGETGWLDRLASMPTSAAPWAAVPGAVIVIAAAATRDALALLGAGGARSLTAVHELLARRFGPPAALPAGVEPLVVATAADMRAAERRLLRAAAKETDGFMARHVERPISLALSRRLASTAVTPNQMTLVSVAIGLAAAPFFLAAQAPWQTAGALLFLLHSIIDGCDGELARLKFQESRWGGILDFWGDNVVHCAIFGCIAAGWSSAAGGALPLLFGAAAILGTLASAGFVYGRVMRRKDGAGPLYTSVSPASGGRLTRLLDALSRRDFIYVALAFALFGKAGWFLLLAALGAPVFFVLLLVLAWREDAAA